MKEQQRERLTKGLSLIGVILFVTVLSVVTREAEDTGSEQRTVASSGGHTEGLGDRPAATTGRPPQPSGESTSAVPPSSGLPLSAATNPVLRDVAELLGALPSDEMIGRRVHVEVDLAAHPSLIGGTHLWTGDGENQMLVVLDRDRRNEVSRLEGEPAEHHIARIEPGQRYTIEGTVGRLPRTEEMASWELSRGDLRRLAARPIYIRADAMRPAF